jgi:hypothetical protein
MKKLFLVAAITYLCSCQSKTNQTVSTLPQTSSDTSKNNTEINTTSIATVNQTTSSAAPTTKTLATNQKTVDYYYQKYANVDSEDPQIGVGPRKIVSVDKVKGILTYIQEGNNETQKIQVWNKNGFDVVDYVGGTLLVSGEKVVNVYLDSEVLKLVKKVGSQRSARGGECDYSETPDLNFKDKVEIVLVCNDDDKFKEVIGYVTIQNGKVVVTEK